MSIELPRQPIGISRRCYKCKVIFLVDRARAPRARQCEPCRVKAKTNPARVRPSEAMVSGHTDTWNTRSLAIMEATYLRMAWGRGEGDFVTRSSNGSE